MCICTNNQDLGHIIILPPTTNALTVHIGMPIEIILDI